MLPEEQYALPEAVGRLFDSTILSKDALRPLADAWCRLRQPQAASAPPARRRPGAPHKIKVK